MLQEERKGEAKVKQAGNAKQSKGRSEGSVLDAAEAREPHCWMSSLA
jgi:hypothetical protein